MNLQALALDYDGTIAVDGVFDPAVRAAIAEAGRRGVLAILVTGRRMVDLRAVAGDLSCFDAIGRERRHRRVPGRETAHRPRPSARSGCRQGTRASRRPVRRGRVRAGGRGAMGGNHPRGNPVDGAAARAGIQPGTADDPAPGHRQGDRPAAGPLLAAAHAAQHHRHRRRRERPRPAQRLRGGRRRGVGESRAPGNRRRGHRGFGAGGRRGLHQACGAPAPSGDPRDGQTATQARSRGQRRRGRSRRSRSRDPDRRRARDRQVVARRPGVRAVHPAGLLPVHHRPGGGLPDAGRSATCSATTSPGGSRVSSGTPSWPTTS